MHKRPSGLSFISFCSFSVCALNMGFVCFALNTQLSPHYILSLGTSPCCWLRFPSLFGCFQNLSLQIPKCQAYTAACCLKTSTQVFDTLSLRSPSPPTLLFLLRSSVMVTNISLDSQAGIYTATYQGLLFAEDTSDSNSTKSKEHFILQETSMPAVGWGWGPHSKMERQPHELIG